MIKYKVLLLEDELQLAKIVSETLQSRGFEVVHAANGRLGLEAFYHNSLSICKVDVMMSFMDGYTFVREIRKTDTIIPVLFLTARSQDKDVVEGYDTGGNDYLKKPFSLEELFLRINELLKRHRLHPAAGAELLIIGGYRLFPGRQELLGSKEQTIRLSNKEAELLAMLARQKNQLLDRKAVLMKLWGDDNPYHACTMDVFITKLRKHLSADATVEIINVRGQG